MTLVSSITDRSPRMRWYDAWFGQVSTFPLSVLRVCMGVILLKTALLNLPIASVFYSDAGVLPRAVAHQLATHLGHLTLMDALPTAESATAFFVLWAVVALGVLIGFQTRPLSVLNFVLILSVHVRNPYLVSGADDMLRLMSFWMIFVPLNRHLSVDAWLARRRGRCLPETTNAFPVRLLQLQVALTYLAAGLFKLLGTSWRGGTALYEVLQVQSLLRPAGQWFALHAPDDLLRILTNGVIVFELGFIVLVFVPFWQPLFRYLGIATLASMHVGIAVTMTTPLLDFVFVFCASYLVFFVTPRPLSADPPLSPPARRRQQGMYAVLALLMGLTVWQIAANYAGYGVPSVPIPAPLTSALKTLGFAQDWSLFAPEPMQYDAYIAVIGTFDDGTSYDLRSGSTDQSAILPYPAALTEYRWGGFQLNVFSHRPSAVLEAWSRYYCRSENPPDRPPRLRSLQIRAIYRRVYAPGQNPNPIQNDLVWLHSCT